MKRGSRRSLGANASVQFFLHGVPMPMDDIDSIEVTNNDNLVSYRPLGTVITISDIDYGNFTLEIKCGKTGSDAMRLADQIEKIHLQAIETPLWDIMLTIRSRDGNAIESYTYHNCVLQFKTVSVTDSKEPITESITATAEKRIVNSLIPPKKIT